MDVSLVMFKSDGTRRDFPINGDRLVIGRKNTCDLRIPLSSVSRQHCEIRLDSGEIKLRDMGSSNGTFHNDARVQEAVLAAGDEVVVGPVVFTLVVDGEPSHIEPVRTMLNGSSDGAPSPAMPGSVLSTDDGELPEEVEAEAHSPTVDLDDPIAALEAMADAEQENDLDEIQILDEDDDR